MEGKFPSLTAAPHEYFGYDHKKEGAQGIFFISMNPSPGTFYTAYCMQAQAFIDQCPDLSTENT